MGSTADLVRGFTELAAARPGYELAHQFYAGDTGDQFTSHRVRRLLARAGIATVDDFNYAKIPVRVISSRLKLMAPVAVPIDDGQEKPDPDSERAKAANRVLSEIWTVNELDAESKALHKTASRFGDAYLFVWPVTEVEEPDTDEEDEFADEPEDFGGAAAEPGQVVGVQMIVNSPLTVRAVYDDDAPLQPAFVIKCWVTVNFEGKNVHRANLYYADHTEKWVTEPESSGKDPKTWHRLPTAPDDIPNPYGRVPFFHYRNDRPYGEPEHISCFGPQRMLNKLVASHAATVDYQVFPQRYYMADPKIDDPLENLNDPNYPEDDDDTPEENTESPLESSPSAVWKLYGKTAGQFEPAQPSTFLQPFDRYVQSMAELSGLPHYHFLVGSGQAPSGTAMRILDTPTVEIVEDRQERYGATWQDAFEFALHLFGMDGFEVPTRWKPAQIVNDTEGWQVIQTKIASGVPFEQALQEAGYSAEQVKDWASGADGADLMRRVTILNGIATAVQALGAGIGLGAVKAEQVQALIGQLIRQTEAGMEEAEEPPWDEPPVEIPAPPAPPGLPASPGAPPVRGAPPAPPRPPRATGVPAAPQPTAARGGSNGKKDDQTAGGQEGRPR